MPECNSFILRLLGCPEVSTQCNRSTYTFMYTHPYHLKASELNKELQVIVIANVGQLAMSCKLAKYNQPSE